MIWRLFSFAMPWVLAALGIYLLSGSLVHLLEAALLGFGTFILGMRSMSYLTKSVENQAKQVFQQMGGTDFGKMFERLQQSMFVPPAVPPNTIEQKPPVSGETTQL